VKDVVKGVIALTEHSQAVGDIFNIGSTEEITIEELARKVKEITNSSSPIAYIPYEEAYEVGFEDMMRRVPDISKISNLIGYKPMVGLEEILVRVRDYYRSKTPCIKKALE